MKNLKLMLFGFLLMFFVPTVHAQVSVNVNIGTPPNWGPAGYNDVRYYYLPDIECYYDVQSGLFIYFRRGVWIHRRHLPPQYRNYDLYGGYKVVMNDYRGDRPYDNFNHHRSDYKRGYRGEAQRNIGERHDNGNLPRGNEGAPRNEQRERGDRNNRGNPGHSLNNHPVDGNNHPPVPNQNNHGNNRAGGNNQPRGGENHGNENHGGRK